MRGEPHQANDPGGANDRDLPPGGWNEQHDKCGHDHERHPCDIRAEAAGHAPYRLGDDGDGYHLQTVQHPGRNRVAVVGNAQREQDQRDGRRQGESGPCRQRAGIAAPRQAHGHADLAAGRAGQELAERDQVGVAALGQPASPRDEFISEVSQMGNRTAEGSQTQAQEDPEYVPRASMGSG